MSTIKKIKAREILDSRGNPTIEVDVVVNNKTYTAAVPSGASTGKHEALELRDKTKRYLGKGVMKAVRNVERKIFPIIKRKDCRKQKEIDQLMIKKDNTENKSRFGANAILGVSLATARAGADSKKLHLFEYLNKLTENKKIKLSLPKTFFNVINGGKHADNKLSFQEFMIVPKFKTFKQNLQAAGEVYHILKKDLHKKYGKGSTNVGDEGGFAPERLQKSTDALKILMKAIKDAGYFGKMDIAMDCAASEFFKRGKYLVDGRKLSKQQLTNHYIQLAKKYPLVSIEDPFDQEDFIAFAELKKKLAENKLNVQIVGDDLTVTNVDRIEEAIREGSCDCLLLKVNQIGSLTEALNAVRLAHNNGWKVMVSHRSGETEDTFIADLAVGINCGQIKAGAPCRGERTAKYNQLLRIEELLSRK